MGKAGSALTAAAATLALLTAPLRAGAAEPLAQWLSGIGEAAQSLADGRPEASELAARRALVARPKGAAAARAWAALGLALSARGAWAEADHALESALAHAAVPAQSHLSWARAEALLAEGDPHGAARLLDLAAADDRLALSRRARLREAEALTRAGLAAEAVPKLERLLAGSPADPAGPAARLALAAARRAVGDAAGAVDAYRSLWLDADLPEARAAGEALSVWRAAGGPVPEASADDLLTRAERLVATARPEEALRELDEVAAQAAATADRARVLRAMALLSLGRHAEAERLVAPLAGDADEAVRRTARLVMARVAARGGRVDDATRWYAEVAASSAPVAGLPEWRQRDLGDEAAYLAAWLYHDAGQHARAAAALERFARAHPRSRRAPEALWFAAWSRYRLGQTAAAARGFARLARGPLADQAAYWQARVTRSRARQRALYAQAAESDGWYGLLARARLAALGLPSPSPPRAAPRPLPEFAPPAASARLAVAVELLGLGLRPQALDELRDLARSSAVRPAAPLVAQLATFAGDAELPFRMARDHLGPTRRGLRWGHPDPLPEPVSGRARALGVDPSLLLAVMRRESSFRPEVRSGAGAEGLLQLMPATAERLAAVLGVPGGVAGRLRLPEVSVELGAHYLGLLLARFPDPAAAVAAYNAGPGPAADWTRSRAGMPLDVWVECIPYRETRQYVKVVLADWDVYRELAGEPPAAIDPLRPMRPARDGVAF